MVISPTRFPSHPALRMVGLALLISALLALAPAGHPAAPGQAAASAFCDALKQDLRRGGGRVGLMVVDLERNRQLCGSRGNRRLILASNTKLFTTAALLGRLGPNKRLTTTLWRVGKVNRRGVLRGDLYLKGAGDPALAMPAYAKARRPRVASNLMALKAQVRAAGIKRVTGRLYADDTIFDRRRGVADSGFATSPYIGPLSGLALNSGFVGLRSIFASDPALLAGNKLLQALRRSGVKIRAGVRLRRLPRLPMEDARPKPNPRPDASKPRSPGGVEPGEEPGRPGSGPQSTGAAKSSTAQATQSAKPARTRARVGRVFSPRISLLSQQINVHSDNFFAETMLKTLGAQVLKKGTTAAGARVVERYARSLGSGVAAVDGSGLTRGNLASPQEVVRLLTAMHEGPLGEQYRNTLPLSGRDGTLVGRMKGSVAERRCEAKTGTLTGVSALSGYCRSRSGRDIAFSILMNEVGNSSTARYYQDQIAIRIAAR